jgi:hypothetical protein
MKAKPLYIFLLLSILFQGCSPPKPQQIDFVGVWKADDGATLELREDGAYNAKNIYYYHIYSHEEDENKKFDFSGTWELEERKDGKFKVNIRSTTEHNEYNFGFTFEILGNGLLSNTPPWTLFVWIGDPDNMNKYTFRKQ